MRNPDLNYPRLTSLAKRIKRTPTYVKSEEVKDWDLEDLLIWIDQERVEHYVTVNMLAIANETTIDRWPFNPDLESLENVVNAELERRGGVVVAPKKKASVPPPKPLPAFEEVYKNTLSDLWSELSAMPKPLVSKLGQFIWTGENASVLMALAQALLTADRIEGKRSAESVYRMLCAYFGEEAADRQRVVSKKGTSTHAYLDYLAAFNDLFQGD